MPRRWGEIAGPPNRDRQGSVQPRPQGHHRTPQGVLLMFPLELPDFFLQFLNSPFEVVVVHVNPPLISSASFCIWMIIALMIFWEPGLLRNSLWAGVNMMGSWPGVTQRKLGPRSGGLDGSGLGCAWADVTRMAAMIKVLIISRLALGRSIVAIWFIIISICQGTSLPRPGDHGPRQPSSPSYLKRVRWGTPR